MTTTDSDRESFLAAIRAESADDTRRLAYADWLDEHDETPRAEFIRVQCELERVGRKCPFTVVWHMTERKVTGIRSTLPPATKPKEPCGWCPVCKLLAREKELLALHADEWKRAGTCAACGPEGKRHVVCTVCTVCNGTGDRGGLLCWSRVDVEFRRGFPFRVTVPHLTDALLDSLKPCPNCIHWKGPIPVDCACNGTRRVPETQPTPWLRSVLAHHPVEEVVPADLTPAVYTGGASERVFFWESGEPDPIQPYQIGAPLWEAVYHAADEFRPDHELNNYIGWRTSERAVAALARAVVRVAAGGGRHAGSPAGG